MSVDRLIFDAVRIGRPADDSPWRSDYRDGMRALRKRRPSLVAIDRVLAVVLTIGVELEIWLTANANGHRLVLAVAVPVTTGTVAIRRRYPAAVSIGNALLWVVLQTFWPSGLVFGGIAWMCDVYALPAWTSARWFAIGLASYVGTSLVFLPFGSHPKQAVPFIVVSTVVILLIRRVLGDRERRAQLAERERDLAAREAVVEERARIARELHDAIAHNVSMMVVQAGAERRVLDDDSSSTREVFETIERIGRGALTEMRRLVGMLRSDGGDPLAPQPALGDLPTLVTQVREAGLPVELHVEGERRDLPVGIELSAYRIVQEALTNALKHAGNASAVVSVRYGADSLELEIIDNGAGASIPVASGGHGLVGMRERVALYGGRFDAGRVSTGGFAVRVLLPTR
jgi:signal transduction histidine kinase